jgi:TolB protein
MKLWFVVVVMFILSIGMVGSAAGYEFIDISNPFLRKTPIAIPYFMALGGTSTEVKLAKTSADYLVETLAFSSFFEVVDRGAFLEEPSKKGIRLKEIGFNNWTAIGAELLITGGIRDTGNGRLEYELRLFDTFKTQMLVGKKYVSTLKDQHLVIRRFCGEILKHMTGHRGVYDCKLAFISTTSGYKEIFITDYDGKNPVQFTAHRSITLFPAWSSDGKWIAYTSYYNNKPDLYIKSVKDKTVFTVNKMGLQITPAWSPKQFELAATLSYQGDQEIYLLTGKGKITKRLTNSRDIDVEPTWSPDGKKIAFVSRRTGSPQIYISDIEGGQVERLTFEGKYNTQPKWSPKGDKIAYSAMEKNEINIYTINVKDKRTTRLTENNGSNESPAWSPDGNLIVFSSNREGPSRIFVMTSYGTDQRRLFTMPGEQTNPRWSPSGIYH